MSISVAMATFNGARFVRQQLDSIVDQSHAPTEIVVSDDGSTDDTVAVVEEFAKTSPVPIRIFTNSAQLGYRANFMQAAALCGSDLIAFCDQDDVWDRDKLRRCVGAFDQAEVLLCYHNAVVTDESGNAIGDLGDYKSAKDIFLVRRAQDFWFNAHGLAQVFRADLLRFSDLRFCSLDHRSEASEPLAHDQWIFALALALGKVRYMPDVLVRYRQHGGNVVGFPGATDWRSYLTRASHMGAAQYLRIEGDAEARALIFRAIARRTEGAERQRAIDASEEYSRLADLYRERARIFSETSMMSRCVTLCRMLVRGSYRSYTKTALGPSAFLKDCSYGLVLKTRRSRA